MLRQILRGIVKFAVRRDFGTETYPDATFSHQKHLYNIGIMAKGEEKIPAGRTADPYAALVESCKKQDRRAQRMLYEKLAGKMFPLCLRYIGERERAKDVMHDGFITLFTKLPEYRGEGSFEGWARRIFVTTALMQLRRNDVLRNSEQIDGNIPVRDIEVDPLETAKMDADKLMELITSMPEGFRTVFNLFAIEGFSHKEIAERLGIGEGGSRSQLSRARIWLQEKIKNYGL